MKGFNSMRRWTPLFLLAFTSCLIGCTTVSNISSGGGRKFTVDGHTYQEVYNASVRAVRSSRDLRLESSSETSGRIVASGEKSAFSWGEVVAVFITTNRFTSSIDVEVVSKHRSTYQLTGPNYEREIVAGIKAELGL